MQKYFVTVCYDLHRMDSLGQRRAVNHCGKVFSVCPALRCDYSKLSFRQGKGLFERKAGVHFCFVAAFFILFFLCVLKDAVFRNEIFIVLWCF